MNDITLTVAGQVCSLGLIRLRVQQQINEIPVAQLELQIPTDSNGSSEKLAHQEAAALNTGSDVTIMLDNTTLFSGYLTSKRIMLRGKAWSIRLEARHLLQKLAFFPGSRVFRQQDDATILNMLLQQAGVKMTRTATSQLATRHDQMVQFRVSDWQFIRSRLFATNCWLIPDAASNGVTVSPLAEPSVVSHQLENYAQQSGYSLYDIDLTFDSRFTPDSLSLQGWDITQQQLSAVQKSNASSFQPWKAGQPVAPSQPRNYQLTFSTLPESAPATLALSWINHQQLTGVQGRIVLEGTRDFQLAESISLSQFGAGLDGTAILTGVNQLFDTVEGWRSELLTGMASFLTQSIPAVQSLHIATVASFTADPQGLERIPISLPALNLPGEYIFARLGKPWASKASGFCFYPEPGDEVIVGFIESDPRYPVIIDSLHNPKNTAPISPDKENNIKGLIVSKGDYTEQLLINTQEKNLTLAAGTTNFAIAADKNIEMTAPETLNLSAKSISYEASDTLSLTGKSKVEITGSSINMKKQ